MGKQENCHEIENIAFVLMNTNNVLFLLPPNTTFKVFQLLSKVSAASNPAINDILMQYIITVSVSTQAMTSIPNLN